MVVAISLFATYWNHADWFTSRSGDRVPTSGVASLDQLSNQGQYGSNSISPQDSAIGVDIDSLPVLLNDLNSRNQTPGPGGTSSLNQQPGTAARGQQPSTDGFPRNTSSTATSLGLGTANSSSGNPSATFDSGVSLTPPSAAIPNLFNSAATNAQGVPQLGIATTAPTPGSSSTSLPSGLNLSNTATTQSPLQSALQQYSSSPNASNSLAPGFGSAGVSGSYSSGQLLPAQIPYSNQLPQTPVLPQTSPPAGTTGYTLPTVLRNVPSSAPNASYPNYGSSSINLGAIATPQIAPPIQPAPYTTLGQPNGQIPGSVINPGINSASPYSAPSYSVPVGAEAPPTQYAQPEPAPFTAPRSRGGGQINTFSNP
jgi:hypothetical protein